MAATAFETIRQAVITALQASSVLGPVIVTDGMKAVSTIELIRQVDVQLADAQGRPTLAGASAPMDWNTVLLIEVKARRAPGDEPDAWLDSAIQAVSQQLATLDAAALGALSIDLDPRWQWGTEPGTPPYARARRFLRIQHRTTGSALAPAP